MEQNGTNIFVKHILDFPDAFISEFNALRDPGTEWDTDEGEKYLANPDNALFLAFKGSQIVGFLTAYRLQRLDKKRAEVLIYEVAVVSEVRRQGVGTLLLEKVMEWTKEIDANEAWVLTNQSNAPAMAFYQSVGGITESSDEQMFTFKVSSS